MQLLKRTSGNPYKRQYCLTPLTFRELGSTGQYMAVQGSTAYSIQHNLNHLDAAPDTSQHPLTLVVLPPPHTHTLLPPPNNAP